MAAVFAARGFDVVGLDVNEAYVDALNAGKAPVDEPGLQDLIDTSRGRLRATTATPRRQCGHQDRRRRSAKRCLPFVRSHASPSPAHQKRDASAGTEASRAVTGL
jgi:hypothetical protein